MNSIVMNFLWAALLLVLIIFLIIFIVDYRAKLKRRAGLKQGLKIFAETNKFHFKKMDFLGRKLIALDAHSHVLAFVRLGQKPLVIDLKNITACQINERRHKKNLHVVELHLAGRNNKLLNILPIYKKGYDNELLLSRYIEQAEKWQRIINNTISWKISVENRLRILE